MINTSYWVITFISAIMAAALGIGPAPEIPGTNKNPSPSASKHPIAEPITVALTGDVMLGRYIETLIDRNGWDNFTPQNTKSLLTQNDIVYINLEGPVTDRKTCQANMCFAFRKDIINNLHDFGNVIAGIANNHILDQGTAGYEDTKKSLQELNIPFAGQVREEQNIYRVKIKGRKISFMGFADFALGSFDDFIQAVQKERQNTDILIVGLHAGPEYLLAPTVGQKEFARAIIDAGADVVAGHHPHVIQPLEIYQEKLIFYSLGNFIFDQFWSTETMRGLIALLSFEEKELCVTPLLAQMNNQGLTTLKTDLGDIESRLFSLHPEIQAEYGETGKFCI